jgi:hypothetical protein
MFHFRALQEARFLALQLSVYNGPSFPEMVGLKFGCYVVDTRGVSRALMLVATMMVTN